MFWAVARYRRRRQAGIKTGDFYVEDQLDTTALPPDEFVTIAHFAGFYDAEMARLKLESEGIECTILGGSEVAKSRSLLLGQGIQLQVKPADASRAAESLSDM